MQEEFENEIFEQSYWNILWVVPEKYNSLKNNSRTK